LLSISTTELAGGVSVNKYKQVFNGVTVEHSAIIVNQMGDKIHSILAEVFDFSNIAKNSAALTETAALDKALRFVKADEYSWQAIEKDKVTFRNNPDAVARLSQLPESKKPAGLLVYARDIYSTNQARLAWKFDVYATNPLSRNFIYVDAENGKILLADAIIKHADKINASAQELKQKQHYKNLYQPILLYYPLYQLSMRQPSLFLRCWVLVKRVMQEQELFIQPN
jgi:Zn-dependent metalloprotease